MNFAPATMGNAAVYGPGFHDVVIKVTGRFVRDVPNALTYLFAALYIADLGKNAAGIAGVLNNKGWIVEGVLDQSGWFSGDYVFEIRAVVGDFYSDAAVQSQIQRDLAELFIVNSISITSPPFSGFVQSTPPGTPPANTQPPTPPVNPNNPGGSQTPILPTVPPSAFDAFAEGLGVSAPVAIMGGVILLVVLFRK